MLGDGYVDLYWGIRWIKRRRKNDSAILLYEHLFSDAVPFWNRHVNFLLQLRVVAGV